MEVKDDMTRKKILALTTKQLDIEIGEKIKGWHTRNRTRPLGRCNFTWHKIATSTFAETCECQFNPSRDIVQAWPIAVSLGLALVPINNGDWACCKASHIYRLKIDQDHYADPEMVICSQAPEAICKMALIVRARVNGDTG